MGSQVTIKQLRDLFEGHISIQEENLAAAYIGKWMKVSERLSEVLSSSGIHLQVTFERPTLSLTELYMYFEPSWKDRLAILNKGDVLIVVGKIDRITRMEVVMDHCELVAS